VSVSIVSATRGSPLNSYRTVWGLWIACSLVHAFVYLQIAVSAARIPQGLLFASALLLQAVGIPLYVLRTEFTSQAQAVIRSTAAAAAFDGLAASVLILTGNRFGTIASSPGGLDPLRSGYIATILLLSGLAGATALGILRWRILEMQQVQPTVQPVMSWSRQYLWSGVLWTAAVTVFCWVISAARWAAGDFDSSSVLPYVVPLAAAGLLLLAPIPILSPARAAEGPQKRIWRYLKYSLAVLFVALGLASPFVMGIWFFLFPLTFLSYAAVFLPPLLSWVVLYVRYVQAPIQTTAPPAQRVSAYQPLRLARPNSRIVWWSAAGQVGALLAGLSSTVPGSLGLHGIGCRSVSPTDATQYWFWKAYKGFASEVNSGSRMILRPAVDPKACMSLDERSAAYINDPIVISDGHVAAARAWAWLIDPEQWDSERSRQIRKELARLLGRDFSSYQELEAWWNQNDQNLVWSASGELVEVRKRDSQVPEDHDVYQLRQLVDMGHIFGWNRLSEPWVFGPKPVGGVSNYPEFTALYFDNEARFRAMRLDVADLIVILSGEQQRRIDEYLHSRFKQDFSTREEWQKFFAQIPRPYPWRMTLQNPENTLGEEWEKGEKILAAYDGPEPFSPKRLALEWLKLLTDQTFDSPEQWVQWWEKNHSKLVLSADGRKLVTKTEN
jgi:hypothetical protein